MLRETILTDIRNAKAVAPGASGVQTLEREAVAFYDDLATLDAALQEIMQDTHLSEEGKQAKRAELGEVWKAKSAQQLEAIQKATSGLLDKGSTAIQPPTEDPALLEAKLGNARSDARMLLESSKPTDLPDRMRELVESNADPVVSYLLVATDWGTNYIRSRFPDGPGLSEQQLNGARDSSVSTLNLWEAYRHDLTPRLLDEKGRKAWERTEALTPLRRVPQIVNAARHFAIMDRRL